MKSMQPVANAANLRGIGIALLAIAFSAAAAAAPIVKAAAGAVPFGQEATLEIEDDGAPAYLPGTRFARGANSFDVDVEFLHSAFGPFPPGVGTAVVNLGELAPGAYEIRTRSYDVLGTTPVALAFGTLRVAAPAQPGLYTIPREPRALSQAQILLNSATHVDATTLRVSMAPELIRVDFEFLPDSPATGPAPAGYSPYVASALPPLNPGHYRMEAWGTPKGGSGARLYFTGEVVVQRTNTVVEFYSEKLDHYFITARAEDIDALDSGAYGGWKRTGQTFHAWARVGDAYPGALPVCRFYAPQHNSHFFTANPSECESLKSEESRGRAEAQSRKQSFVGWQFEDIAFYAMPPVDGVCPYGTTRISRAYNNRAALNDANHRFTSDGAQSLAMMSGWLDEGIAFCSPL
jgi:hypothetical protein